MLTIEKTDPLPEAGDAYRYDRFTPGLLFRDLRFSSDALAPGDSLPGYELATLEGGTIQIGGDRERPLLLVTGSITCPMTASALPVIKELHAEFGDRVDFVLLNVREAHPGAHLPQPATDEEKLSHARSLRERYHVPFTFTSAWTESPTLRSFSTPPVRSCSERTGLATTDPYATRSTACSQGLFPKSARAGQCWGRWRWRWDPSTR